MNTWEYSTPIPLMRIGKETILGRLERQLWSRGYSPITVSDDLGILAEARTPTKEFPHHIAEVHLEANRIYSSETLGCALDGATDGFIITSVSDYWRFVREILNAGKLDR